MKLRQHRGFPHIVRSALCNAVCIVHRLARPVCNFGFGCILVHSQRILTALFIHVEQRVQLRKTRRFFSQFRFLRKGTFGFFLCLRQLLFQGFQSAFHLRQRSFNACQRIGNAQNVTLRVFADFHRVVPCPLDGQAEHLIEVVKPGMQFKRTVAADSALGASRFQSLASLDNGCTCFLAFAVHLTADFHREVVFVLRQKRFCRFHIGFQCFNLTLCRSDFSRIAARNIRFQAINLTGVIGFQQLQFADLNIQIHLFLDIGIARRQCLDFGIRQCGIVHIITGADRRFGSHDLRNELLLIFQNLPHIRIKRIFSDITINFYLLISVSLPENTPFLLFQVRRLPRAIQMMQGNQPILNIGSRAKFRRRPHQDTHLSGAHLCKKLCLFGFRVILVNERHFLTGNTSRHQLFPHIIINIECAIGFWCR